jgi:hypothetical protein
VATPLRRLVFRAGCALAGLLLVCGIRAALTAEPPALNPFGQAKMARDDAIPGYIEVSDGRILVGNIYMTRDKRVRIYDEKRERQRELPLRVITEIQAKMVKEGIEKEWRFKELALDEKMYTGRTYPWRQYVHTVTLKDGTTITGELAEVFFVQPIVFKADQPLANRPDDSEPLRIVLHKKDKGDFGAELKSMKYVKLIKLGKEALEEGRKKAAHQPVGRSSAATHSRPAKDADAETSEEKPEKVEK